MRPHSAILDRFLHHAELVQMTGPGPGCGIKQCRVRFASMIQNRPFTSASGSKRSSSKLARVAASGAFERDLPVKRKTNQTASNAPRMRPKGSQ